MKKVLMSLVLAGQLCTVAFAGGDVEPLEVEEVEVEQEESKFYVVVKALAILGDSAEHGKATLDGDRDYGFGIDVGYRLGYGFALEYDFSFSKFFNCTSLR